MGLQSTAVFRVQTGGGGSRNQSSNSRNAVNTVGNNPQFQFTCYNCGVPGHKRYDCPKPQQPWRPFNQQPQGLSEDPKVVCKLNKALYGLKQAPREWNFLSHNSETVFLLSNMR
jgi:hypothetical protein